MLTDDKLTVTVIVNDKILPLQQEIHNTLRILSKKWPGQEITTTLSRFPEVRVPQTLTYFNVLNSGSPSVASTFRVKTYVNTYNYTETPIFNKDWWWFNARVGSERDNPTLGITIKPEFRQDKKLKLNFTIQVVDDPRWSILLSPVNVNPADHGIIVSAGLKMWSLYAGYEFTDYEEFQQRIKKQIFASPGTTFSDFLILPKSETSTTLLCTFTAIANATFDINNAEFLKFLSVTLEYID